MTMTTEGYERLLSALEEPEMTCRNSQCDHIAAYEEKTAQISRLREALEAVRELGTIQVRPDQNLSIVSRMINVARNALKETN